MTPQQYHDLMTGLEVLRKEIHDLGFDMEDLHTALEAVENQFCKIGQAIDVLTTGEPAPTPDF